LRGSDTSSSYVGIVSKYQLGNIRTLNLGTAGTRIGSCTDTVPAGRAALGAQITVNTRSISLFSVRTTSEGELACIRNEQNRALKTWAKTNYSEPFIYGGDFNMQPYAGEVEYQTMINNPDGVYDSWSEAVDMRTAVAFDGNPTDQTPTRNTRMDYVFLTRAQTLVEVVSAKITDVGGLSDHRMMMSLLWNLFFSLTLKLLTKKEDKWMIFKSQSV
jgi:endonuclease/exonuclease/phosphatase family metal-dependent hydrolase